MSIVTPGSFIEEKKLWFGMALSRSRIGLGELRSRELMSHQGILHLQKDSKY